MNKKFDIQDLIANTIVSLHKEMVDKVSEGDAMRLCACVAAYFVFRIANNHTMHLGQVRREFMHVFYDMASRENYKKFRNQFEVTPDETKD